MGIAQGAVLTCVECRKLIINGSSFASTKAMKGGAIYIKESDSNKLSTDSSTSKYKISSTSFLANTAYSGGAIFLDNP